MGLDMTIDLFDKNEIDIKFLSNEDLKFEERYVSNYYRLNWAGVRAENLQLLGKYMSQNIKSFDSNYTGYCLVKENGFFAIKSSLEINPIDHDIWPVNFLHEELSKLEFSPVVSPIKLITQNLWNGSNGEFILLKRESSYKNRFILSNGKIKTTPKVIVAYINDERIELDIELKNHIKYINSCIKLCSSTNYIEYKSEQILKMYKWFLTNKKSELCIYMG